MERSVVGFFYFLENNHNDFSYSLLVRLEVYFKLNCSSYNSW